MSPAFLTAWLPASKKSARRRAARLGVEYLEERLAPAAGLPPDVVVGRTLSAYTVDRVQNNVLDVTYTVYNQTADDVTGVLLTSTLRPGVSFAAATALPDRSGQELAWSLGTLPAFGRASVTMTVTFPASVPLQIDSGARAFGTRNAGAVTDDAPAAALVNRIISTDVLASTPDANTTDPFVQEQAARLDYDPQRIFDYLNDEVGYESYTGSLRGARGTMWSAAGNALDEASLGVALFRASGIPARYAQGTLSDPLAQHLILSMFPPSFQTVGYIPVGTPVADPANDPQLLTETRQHYWLQIDTGGGFVNADTSGLSGGAIGTAFTAATGTFTEVADTLRHKLRVAVDVETFSQIGAAFGLGNGLSTTTVLDRIFNTVDLVGRPLTFGNFVTQTGIPGLVFVSRTSTYSPYLITTDEALTPGQQAEPIRGTDFQEVQTNFPLGNQLLTGVLLRTTGSGPGGPPQADERYLVDRVGFAARQGVAGVSVSVDPNGPPALSALDVFTLTSMAGATNPRSPVGLEARVAALQQRVADIGATLTGPSAELTAAQRDLVTAATQLTVARFAQVSGYQTGRLASLSRIVAYADRPRLILTTSRVRSQGPEEPATVSFSIDLRRDDLRVLAAPGQTKAALPTFRYMRGVGETVAERQAITSVGPADAAGSVLNTQNVIETAARQGVKLVLLVPTDVPRLDALLDASPDALARISATLGAGRTVLVPERPVVLAGQPTTAWYDIDPVSGNTIGVTADGGHHAIGEYAAVLGLTFILGISLGSIAINLAPADFKTEAKFLWGAGLTGVGLAGGAAVATPALAGTAFATTAGGSAIVVAAGGLGPFSASVFGFFALGFVLGGFLAAGKDPPAEAQLYDISPDLSAANAATATVTPAPAAPAGSTTGTVATRSAALAGGLAATWSSTVANQFQITALTANGATVRDATGAVRGTGAVALAAGRRTTVTSSGGTGYSVRGTGRLAAYADAATGLGVAGDWSGYSADLTGDVALTFTTDALTVNGTALPAGTYTVSAPAATLTGSGLVAAPSFAGTASVAVTDGVVYIGPGTGSVASGGAPLDTTNGASLTGYTGAVTLAAGGTGPDTVTLNGVAGQVIRVAGSPPAAAVTPSSPADIQVSVTTSLAGGYDLTAEAPPGWRVVVGAGGVVTVIPAAGTEPGIYSVRILARAKANADLIAQAIVPVTVAAAQPGLTLAVQPDEQFTVTYSGTALPTGFRANVTNLGPAADTYTVTATGLPAGFSLKSSGGSLTVPAGATGTLGLYLVPAAGAPLPAPGAVLTFAVTATSATNPALTQTQTITFTVPAVRAVVATVTPAAGTVPGGSADVTLALRAVGNVPEAITLTSTLGTGLTAAGVPTTVNLGVGESATYAVHLTVAADAPLNSTPALLVTVLTTTTTQNVSVPVRVAAPGADAIANAAVTAAQLGNPDLANRLNDLATALTTLFQIPAEAVPRAQALAALDAILGLLGADPFLSAAVGNLRPARDQLAAAVGAAQVQAAIMPLGTALGGFGTALADTARHGFELFLPSNTAVALPGVPAVYIV
ncbi:MAG TPA: transglutaminase domain-containing protein, partial [Urbifossiella sp.]|nr:transglutaminase domain-containing protein [Urbifossiella sp.]